MIKKIGVLLFAIFSMTAQAQPETGALPASTNPPPPANALVIHFGTDATYPPFESMDAKGNIQGFDIDIANAICEKIKATCTFTSQPFKDLIPMLNEKKFDALISGISITDERKQQVDFTVPYFFQTAIYITNRANYVPGGANVKGKTIGTQGSTVMEKFLRDIMGNTVTIKVYPNINDAFTEMKAGKIDYVLVDTPIGLDWLKQKGNENYQMVGEFMTNLEYFGQGYGIAVQKGNKLLDQLNDGIQAIKRDGTRYALMKKYFGG